MSLYHGGVRGIYPGGLILPPARTQAPTMADVTSAGVCRRDRVYLTADLRTASLFALLHPPRGGGSVYEVEPIGELEPDPYLSLILHRADPSTSFAAPEARVVRVVERNVREWGSYTFRSAIREIDRRLLSRGLPRARALMGAT